MSSKLTLIVVTLLSAFSARAQMVEVTDKMDGEQKARQYFEGQKSAKGKKKRAPASEGGGGSAPHYLSLHLGTYVDDQAYRWSGGDQHNVGQVNVGVTYRLGEWVNTADFMIRSEYSAYSLDDGSARKLDFIAMLMFPDSSSRFPLYFAAGIGPGFYLKQLHGHSSMSLDYQIVGGVRFLNVFDRLGFLAEFGMKSDFQLFSPGQFNGLFAGVGTVWTF